MADISTITTNMKNLDCDLVINISVVSLAVTRGKQSKN